MRTIGRMTSGLGVLTNLYQDHLIFGGMLVASLFVGSYIFGQ